jgi:hypothetical protein
MRTVECPISFASFQSTNAPEFSAQNPSWQQAFLQREQLLPRSARLQLIIPRTRAVPWIIYKACRIHRWLTPLASRGLASVRDRNASLTLYQLSKAWISTLFMAKDHTNYCGLVHGPHVVYTSLPKLLWNFCSNNTIHKCGHVPQNTAWRAAGTQTWRYRVELWHSCNSASWPENPELSGPSNRQQTVALHTYRGWIYVVPRCGLDESYSERSAATPSGHSRRLTT